MDSLNKLEIPLTALICDDCKAKDNTNIAEIPTYYVEVKVPFIPAGGDDIITVSMDVRKIEWQKETAGQYRAKAVLSILCPCCETPKDIRYHLEAPIIFISEMGFCRECKGKLLLSDEHIEYFYDDNEQAFITIKGLLTCPNCAKHELTNLQLSAPEPSTILQAHQININGNVARSTIIIGNENKAQGMQKKK